MDMKVFRNSDNPVNKATGTPSANHCLYELAAKNIITMDEYDMLRNAPMEDVCVFFGVHHHRICNALLKKLREAIERNEPKTKLDAVKQSFCHRDLGWWLRRLVWKKEPEKSELWLKSRFDGDISEIIDTVDVMATKGAE